MSAVRRCFSKLVASGLERPVRATAIAFTTAIGIAGTPSALGQDQIPLVEGSFVETFSDVPLAGGVRVGLLAGSANDTIREPKLGVYLPKQSGHLLCLEVTSQDGRYSAQARYHVGPTRAGPHRLEFPTSKEHEIRSYHYTELAILAALDNGDGRCYQREDVLVVAFWDDPPPLTSIVLLANGGSDDVEILSEYSAATKCVRIRGGVTPRAYNVACHLDHALSKRKLWELEIRRHLFDRERERIPVQLAMP